MAIRLSTGMRNGSLDGQSFKALMNGGKLAIFSGGQPANADAAETGSKLVEVDVAFGTSGTGALPVLSSWAGTIGTAGIAGWFRLYGTAGSAGASTTEVRMDGNCGVSGADLNFTNTTLRAGATLTVDEFTLIEPAS